MTAADGGYDDVLGAEDRAVLSRIADGNTWLRSVLCTLARRGTLLRRRQPGRAAALLDALAPWPWFKGGQFLFDLMEWEDFMVDGPPPPLLGSVLGSGSVHRLAGLLATARGLLDDAGAAAWQEAESAYQKVAADIARADDDLPDLEPGLHLYRDVVLGAVLSIGPVIVAAES